MPTGENLSNTRPNMDPIIFELPHGYQMKIMQFRLGEYSASLWKYDDMLNRTVWLSLAAALNYKTYMEGFLKNHGAPPWINKK